MQLYLDIKQLTAAQSLEYNQGSHIHLWIFKTIYRCVQKQF